jgi:hypothetical protein
MSGMINSRDLARTIVRLFILLGLLHTASALGNDMSELKQLVSSYDDPKMTAQDLAFYLVTHNYDATPKDGYVELQLDGENYKLVPNGEAPGLCDISLIDSAKK